MINLAHRVPPGLFADGFGLPDYAYTVPREVEAQSGPAPADAVEPFYHVRGISFCPFMC